MSDVNRRWWGVLALAVLALLGVALADDAIDVADASDPTLRAAEARLHASYPHLRADQLAWSAVPQLVEVTTGTQVAYYAPEPDLLLIGELIDRTGASLTQRRADALQRDAIPADAGVVVGEGTRELRVFVDPDCGYCAQAAAWLTTQTNLRSRVVFLSLHPGSSAEARAQSFVCSPESSRLAALPSVFARSSEPSSTPPCSEASAELARHAAIATTAGIRATPTFVIGDETVAGFDPTRLQAALDAAFPSQPRSAP